MKKLFVIFGLSGLFAMQANASDLLGSMKKATSKVEAAQTKVDETKAAADAVSSPDQAALALVKSKLPTGSTKEQVRKKLGEPAGESSENGSEVWSYDVSALNKSLGDKAAIASAVGVNVPGADKRVNIVFKSEKLHTIALAGEQAQ